jgi:Kef-type K+ transport system membrane component KefB
LLGPSAISKNSNFRKEIMASASLAYLQLVANLGLLLYLFVVGMELDINKLMTHAKRAGSVALLGMAVPFALGRFHSQSRDQQRSPNCCFVYSRIES